MEYGRETLIIFEVDIPFCRKRYGETNAFGTCSAVLGTDSQRKCFQTRATCAVPADYDPATLTLRFMRAQEGLLQYGPLIPSLIDMETTPSFVNLAAMDKNTSALGSREVVTVNFEDHKHSDHLVDKYRLERITGAAQTE